MSHNAERNLGLLSRGPVRWTAPRKMHDTMTDCGHDGKPTGLNLTFAMADQDFQQTPSLGILNLSTHLLRTLAGDPRIGRLQFLGHPGLHIAGFHPDPPRISRTDVNLSGRPGRLWWDQIGLYSAARQAGPGWLFLPKGFASFLRRPPVRLCAYVHDIMLEIYRRRYPGIRSGVEIRYFLHCLRATLKTADLIFTNSEFTRRELTEFSQASGISPPDIRVAGIGFDAPRVMAFDRSRETILVLASPLPHKLTPLAVEYLDHWQRATGNQAPVAWVGRLPEGLTLPDHANWRHHPRLPEAEYRRLLESSRLLLYFTDYEGFGMPPVEAVLAGACPVFSNIPPVIEVIEGAGVGFENASRESFASAMSQAGKITPMQIGAWKSRLLARHDWKLVANRIVEGMLSCPPKPETLTANSNYRA